MAQRVLILGATGMLGHVACKRLGESFDVFGACRGPFAERRGLDAFLSKERCFDEWDCRDIDALRRMFEQVRPSAVLNCAGLVKQRKEAEDPLEAVTINSLFPHQVATLCDEFGARLIQISTDCVFSGQKGMYRETDPVDPPDLYGRSKLLGEVLSEPHLTIRTSMIGREIATPTGLLEWFLSNRGGQVKGFSRAVFSGLTTDALAEVVRSVLEDQPHLTGLYHVAAEPIDKWTLLNLINERLGLGIAIEKKGDFFCDRSLNGERFAEQSGVEIPSWKQMIDKLEV